jgi:hypothetical protein
MENKKDDLPLTPKQIKALFKEWNADYAAARERDGHLKFGQIIHGPGSHPKARNRMAAWRCKRRPPRIVGVFCCAKIRLDA